MTDTAMTTLESPEFLAHLDQFVEARTVARVMEAEAKPHELALKKSFVDWFCRELWEKRAVPQNPKVTTMIAGLPNHAAIFQVKAMFRPVVPPLKNRSADKDIKDYLIDSVERIGFPRRKAVQIVADNIRVDQMYAVQSSAAEDVVSKFLRVIFATSKAAMTALGVFTDSEREELFGEPKETIRIIAPEQLFRRILEVSPDFESLRGLVEFFNPDISISNIVFAQSAKMGDTPKLDAATRIIGEH